MSSVWKVFSDGGSRGNPGNAACAFSIFEEDVEIYHSSRYLGMMTNNEAEYWGIIDSLVYLLSDSHNLILPEKIVWNLDSNLVVEQILGNWKVKENRLKTLVEKARSLLSKFPGEVVIQHVYREANARADELVNECLDKN